MSDDVDSDLEELKRQTSHGDRLDEAAHMEGTRQFQADILNHLEAIEGGNRQKTVSVWDGQLAALVTALDEDGNENHLQTVGDGLQEALGVERDDVDRSEVLRLAFRLGLREAAPEYVEMLRGAIRDHATRRL